MTTTCWWCGKGLAPKPRHEGFFSWPVKLPTGAVVLVHKVCQSVANKSFKQEMAMPEREGFTGLTKPKPPAE